MAKPIISADSHITEPPDCYVKHIDPAFRDRAPYLKTIDGASDVFGIVKKSPAAFVST